MNDPLHEEDAAARTSALDTSRSIVAQAPAGSGKTTLLLHRYLHLLTLVDAPEEILIVTFTRKAAGEIRERVQRALERTDDDVVAAVRQRDTAQGWGLTIAPNRLRIQTIDAFALSIARQAPVLAALPPQCTFAEDALPLYRTAVDALFERMSSSSPFHDDLAEVLLLFENDYAACADALCAMLAKRDQWLDAVRLALTDADGHGVAQLIDAGVGSLASTLIGDVRAVLGVRRETELLNLLRAAAAELGRNLIGGDGLDAAKLWRFAGELLTTQGGRLRRMIGIKQGFPSSAGEAKRQLHALLEAFREEELDELMYNLRLLPDAASAFEDAPHLRRIAITLSLAALELSTVFERSATVDFTELTFAARRALGTTLSPTDLAMSLDYRLRHLLVDEFQDTSVTQLDLLRRITEGWQEGDGRTFFAVGDPMQSIYRFRDAEVALMLRAVREGIGELRPTGVRLRTNFRAVPQLVHWVNRVFGRAFGRSNDPQLGRVAYADAVAAREPNAAARVRARLFANDADRETETRRVLETIQDLRRDDPASSVALLARSRSHVQQVLTSLSAHGVPWHGEDIERIGDSVVVRDLMALLDAMADPDNRVAWLSLLRAPFIGIGLADLHTIAGEPRITDGLSPAAVASLSNDAQRRLARVGPTLERAIATRDQELPAAWLERLWHELAGPDAYPDATEAAAHAEQVFGLITRGGSRRIDHDALRSALQRASTHSEPTPGDVIVMTIHRAKGLEFDHVLIPGIDRETRRSEPPLLLWRQERNALLMSTSKAVDPRTYRWLAREERLRETYERIRLFYVAVTRARVSAHLFGCWDDPSIDPAPGSLLHCVWPALREEIVVEPRVSADATQASQRNRMRLRADYTASAPDAKPPLSVAPEAPARVATASNGLALSSDVDRVLRRVLSALPAENATHWVQRARKAWRASLGSAGVRSTELESGVETIARHVQNVFADPRGRWLFGEHRERAVARRYTVLDSVSRVRIDVDRAFVDASAQRWLVMVDTSADGGCATELGRWLGRIIDSGAPPARRGVYSTATSQWLEVAPSLDFAPAG